MTGAARSSPVRVVLIGSDSPSADQIRSTLAVSASMSFEFADAPTVAKAVDLPDFKECDVILLDLSRAKGDGMSLLASARSRFPQIPIVVLNEADDEALALRAIRAGARGYILRAELCPRLLITNLAAAVGIQHAIVQLNESRERERHLVTHDQLTGLANRALFKERLSQSLATARRDRKRLGLIIVNLDEFKAINQQLGRAVGDGLLRGIARQILSCLGEGDSAARFSSDEFAIVLRELSDENAAANLAEKILETVRRPHLFTPQSSRTTASIGVATFPKDGADPEDLIHKADMAMQHAKRAGGNRTLFYSPGMNAALLKRSRLESRLRGALEDGQFELHYQPQFDVCKRRVTGAEGLIRWRHPRKGLMAPAEFLPIAEESGLIIPIGEWVLREGCRQGAEWRAMGHGDLRISLNVASEQLHQPDFTDIVRSALRDSQIPPAMLELEITEGGLLQDAEGTMKTLRDLKDLGVHLAIDDFGTGYSSLAYLKRLPLDVLKVDQSFVRSIVTDPANATITSTIVKLAHGLGLATVAEGVETPEQLLLLASYGCTRMQGFLVGRPAPPETFLDGLNNPTFRGVEGQTDAPT